MASRSRKTPHLWLYKNRVFVLAASWRRKGIIVVFALRPVKAVEEQEKESVGKFEKQWEETREKAADVYGNKCRLRE